MVRQTRVVVMALPGMFSGGKKIVEAPRCAVNLSKVEIHDTSALDRAVPPGTFSAGDFVMTVTIARNTLAAFVFDGNPVVYDSIKSIGRGSFGDVYQCSFVDGTTLAVKFQEWTLEAVEQLEVAKRLLECDLIEFRAIYINDCLITIMPMLEVVGKMTSMDDKLKYQDIFVAFLRDLNACLEAAGASYGDMKCANIAFCPFVIDGIQTAKFRLIDLDGVNGKDATYPYASTFGDDVYYVPTAAKRLQTLYASAVTALVYWKQNRSGSESTLGTADDDKIEDLIDPFYRHTVNNERRRHEYQNVMDRLDTLVGYVVPQNTEFPGGEAMRNYIRDTCARARAEVETLAQDSRTGFARSLSRARARDSRLPQKRAAPKASTSDSRTLSLPRKRGTVYPWAGGYWSDSSSF